MVKWIRYLSLDVAAGASIMMAFTASVFEVSIDLVYYFLLFLMTWLIYTTDHLMDARNIPHEASTPRHRFHQMYYRPILSAAIIGLFVFIGLIPRETTELLFRLGLGLAGLVLLYFLSLIWARKTQFRYVLKEVFIAFCYTAGVALVPAYLDWPLSPMNWVFLMVIFLLALGNVFIFSLREMKFDLHDEHPSAIRFLGQNTLKTITALVLWMACGLNVYITLAGTISVGLCFLSMNNVLLLLYYFPSYFQQKEWYRILGDGVFLMPVLYLMFRYF
ncbi:MAG: hypothetical protein LPK45_02250 [Bacteroidota bacterium]|nr:hypothetical protein [Bacteroidota bacterium]MDX5429855.1 hypothetical protein [Bacteroidota bacterium]MDX5468634.1 hypothetical protein [Bacteroidota bacterium]